MISVPSAMPEHAAASPLHVVARVGGERFAFPVIDVDEAIDAPQIDWVPGAGRGLAGQLRYRDRTVSAFDGGWALGIPRTIEGGTALILRDGARRLAVMVDDVDDLTSFATDAVHVVPAGTDRDGVLSGVWLAGAAQLVGIVNTEALVIRLTTFGASAVGEAQ